VKTSILILDRAVAKASKHVAFFKIENDGFALGAQRKAVKGSQLAQVKAELGAWLQVARVGDGEQLESNLGFAVPRSEFAAAGDYNLSSERYRQEVAAASKWQRIKIGDVCKTGAGGTPATDRPEFYKDGVVPWLKSGEISQGEIFSAETYITEEALNSSSAKIFPPNAVLVAMYGATAGEVGILRMAASTNQAVCALVPDARLDPNFLYRLLRHNKATLIRFAGGGAQPNISQKIVRDIEIPLPPLEIQREIVAEVEGYQRIIDGARAVLDNYRPHIPVDPEWPSVELGEIFEALEAGVSVNSENRTKLPGEIGVLKTSAVTSGIFNPDEHKAVLPEEVDRVKCSPRKGSIIISRMNTEALVGASAYVEDDFPDLFLPDRLWQTVITRPDVSAKYIHTVIASDEYRARISSICGGTSGSMKNVAKSQLLKIVVPLPDIEIQEAIVADIEAEQALVNGNRDLIARFEKKIEAAMACVWGEAKAAVAA